ncbi:protein TANC2 [Ciona intestinalis]
MELADNSRGSINRKPKFVEIPSVPTSDHGSGTSSASSTSKRHDDVTLTSADDEPDPALMATLGLFLGDQRVSHVKTTSHHHPLLSQTNIIGNNNDIKKKQTTSPASTLSDKGIGSSVGSFDSEFRHTTSQFLPASSNPPYDVRSGSLDSRTHELAYSMEQQAPSHTRSSSDIIITDANAAKTSVTHPKLAEQSSVPLWNSDPRRGSKSSSLTSQPRPRRPSTRRQRPSISNSDANSIERAESDKHKLPQLCRDSPGHSTRSSVSSSRSVTPAVSVCEMSTASGNKNFPKSKSNSPTEPLPPPPPPPPEENGHYDITNELPPPPPPPPVEQSLPPPPLPPKNKIPQQLHSSVGLARQNSLISSKPDPPVYQRQQQQQSYINDFPPQFHLQADDTNSTASSTLKSRIRLSSDSTTTTVVTALECNDRPGQNAKRVWSQDQRREVPVPMSHSPLTPSMSTSALGRTESTGRLMHHHHHHAATRKPAHGSTSALWEAARPHSLSAPTPYPNQNEPASNDRNTPSPNTYDDGTFSRQSMKRSSTRSNPGERRRPDPKAVRFAPYRHPEVTLQPLAFDISLAVASETKFVGREWVFSETLVALTTNDLKTNKGVIITGAAGHGKTALIDHLVSFSYHGSKKQGFSTLRSESDTMQRLSHSAAMVRSSSPLSNSRQFYHPGTNNNHLLVGSNQSSRTNSPAFGSTASSRAGSQSSLTEDNCRKLASQVVAFHFCQAENNSTCYVPEFLHSVAAQLSQAPQLTSYRELLLNEPHLQNILSIRSCIQNPIQAFSKGIVEPLVRLRKANKLPRSNLVIAIDALNEAELYRPDYGLSIFTFLQRHLQEFPDFLKVVATLRTEDRNLAENLPVSFVSLDGDTAHIVRDSQLYINHRISSSQALSNLTLSGKSDPTVTQKHLGQHLIKTSKGNFLFLRLTLDLIEKGSIVPKSSGFKVIPVSVHEVFLLMCNLRFMSYTSFDDVRDVIAVALASLYPLKDDHIYQAVCSGLPPNQLPKAKFKSQMDMLSELLVLAPSGGRIFFHSCFREWLLDQTHQVQKTGTLQSSSKFRVDVKHGHALLATVLSLQPPTRLHKHATLELAHHVLKAGMFKNQSKQSGMSSSEQNASFMARSSQQLTEALSSLRNLFFPNMKVSKLLLRSGANPNTPTEVFSNATPLSVVAHTGCIELATLLLMFGADVNQPAINGMAALTFAAAAGRHQVVDLLLRYRPALNQVDQNGQTALLHAILRGHTDVAKLLLTCDLYASQQHRNFAAQQAVVAAATIGDMKLIQYLLEHEAFQCDVNAVEATHGESPLTSAAAHGKSSVCEFLIRNTKANVEARNKSGANALLCAVKQGEWDTADLLLNLGASLESRDPAGKTPLITASCNGHLGVLELLLSRGASVVAADREGLTALSWAALQGHAPCVRSLVERHANVAHRDASGRTALDLASFYGDPQIVDLLLDAGSDISHVDASGMCALDRAIGCQNIAVVSRLLRRGAEIALTSWAMSSGKADVTAVLLNKSLEDGNTLYKAFDFVSASEIYARALKHIGELSTSRHDRPQQHGKMADLSAHLLLGYSRCLRKLGDLDGAESSATRALELKPLWHEALYARARVLREAGRLNAALCDVIEAEKSAPPHNMKEIRRLIERIKEEVRRGVSKNSRPPSTTSEMNIPHRSRVNSTSSYHGNRSRGASPSEMSRSFQAPRTEQQRQLNPLYTGNPGQLGRGNSQESLAESMLSLSSYEPSRSRRDLSNVSRRAPPRTNPHWRPRVPDFQRSYSEDHRAPNPAYPQHGDRRHFDDDTRSLCADVDHVTLDGWSSHPTYNGPIQNGYRYQATEPARTSFVTNL